jgi:hypothetical protein
MAESISPKKIEQATAITAAVATVTPASSKRKGKSKLSEEIPAALSKSPKPQQKKQQKPQPVSTEEHHLVTALRRIDPLLQFLTRATGLSTVPVATLRAALPAGYINSLPELALHLQELVTRGILHSCRLSNE